MKFKIVDDLGLVVDNIVPDKYLSRLQEFLLSGAIFTDASQFLVMLAIFILDVSFDFFERTRGNKFSLKMGFPAPLPRNLKTE